MTLKSTMHSMNIATILLLLSLLISIIAYLLGISTIYYLAFLVLLSGLLLMTYAIWSDLYQTLHSLSISFLLILSLLIIYWFQRQILFESAFMIGDSSDYFWSGVSASLHGDDIGFFLPMTASLSAIGYQVFGLHNTPMIMVLFSFSNLALFYFLFRRFYFSSLQSYILILLFQFIPLCIWFSKAIYSEALWQVIILIFIIYTYTLSKEKTLVWSNLIVLIIILLLSGLTRGTAVLFYGWIIFLSLYHFWNYGSLKNAIIISLGMFILAFSIHYSVHIRPRYLLEWQFARLIPNITLSQLLIILYSIPFLFIGLLSTLTYFKRRFIQSDFPLIIVILSILFKIGIAVYFATKKQLDIIEILYINELGLAIGNFGLLLTCMIVIGILYMYYLALKGNRLVLIIILLYTFFSIPFVMQNVSFDKTHVQLLYWNRYYFSEVFIVHFFALSLFIKLFFDLIGKYITLNTVKFLGVMITFIVVFFYSINMKLYHFVSEEGYLTNTSYIFTWVSKRSIGKKLSVVYSENISFNNFDAKHLLHKGFYITGTKVKNYQKVIENQLNTDLMLKGTLLKNDLLLCISTSSCNLNSKNFIILDKYSTTATWREHEYNILESKIKKMPINIFLFEIKKV